MRTELDKKTELTMCTVSPGCAAAMAARNPVSAGPAMITAPLSSNAATVHAATKTPAQRQTRSRGKIMATLKRRSTTRSRKARLLCLSVTDVVGDPLACALLSPTERGCAEHQPQMVEAVKDVTNSVGVSAFGCCCGWSSTQPRSGR